VSHDRISRVSLSDPDLTAHALAAFEAIPALNKAKR
jgi:hypothetical protein